LEGPAANEEAAAEPVFLDEDAEGPLMDLVHAEEVLATITRRKDPAQGLDSAMKVFSPIAASLRADVAKKSSARLWTRSTSFFRRSS
jgi:hypothetical protein